MLQIKILLRKINPYSEGYIVYFWVSLVTHIVFRNTRNSWGLNQILFNPLKPELNSICYLLALLGAHHFLHVSRIRVKLLTLR